MPLTTPAAWRYFGETDDEALAALRAWRGDPFPESWYDDAALLAALASAVSDLEGATGRFFIPKSGTMELRGQGVVRLFVPHPIVELTAVSVRGTAVDLDLLDVNDGVDPGGTEDPRDNPWIEWLSDPFAVSYLAPESGTWPPETAGPVVVLTGTFGYLEADGSTPQPILDALIRLTLRQLVPVTDAEGQGDLLRGAVIMEQTAGRSYQLAQGKLSSGMFLDREIDRVIQRYRAPAPAWISRSRRPGRARRSIY